jgi:hypothetical protein
VLIVDESIEKIVYDCLEVPKHLQGNIEIEKIECDECPSADTCEKYREGWKFGMCYSKLIKKP